MSKDTIYRQDALDTLDALCNRECEYSKKQRIFMCSSCHLGSAIDAIDALDCINGVEEVLRALPSVQPDRKTGVWRLVTPASYSFSGYRCSECRDVIRGLATTLPSATCDGCKHKNTLDDECKECIRIYSFLHDNYEEEHT